jgi:DNA-directed RNA polymerase sigma subunit (sigma70/sigma32)
MGTHAAARARAERIRLLHRQGYTLRHLAGRFRLSYERVRQIVRRIDPNHAKGKR